MSLWDSVLSNTVGFVWRGATGTVDPWTKAQIDADNQAGVVKATGPQATPQQKAKAAADVVSLTDNFLKSIGAHPDQAVTGLGTSIKQALVWLAIFAVVAIGVFGFAHGKGARVATVA